MYYLSFYFVIEELLLEFGQSVMSTIIVQVQGIQHVPAGDSSKVFIPKSFHLEE